MSPNGALLGCLANAGMALNSQNLKNVEPEDTAEIMQFNFMMKLNSFIRKPKSREANWINVHGLIINGIAKLEPGSSQS